MRWRMLVITSVLTAGVTLLTGCGSSAPASPDYSTNYSYTDQDATACTGLNTPGVPCDIVHRGIELSLAPMVDKHGKESFLNGLTITLERNKNGTVTVTWSTTNPQMKILGATDGLWASAEEDILYQQPYTSKPGDVSVVLHIDTPHPSQWELVRPTAS